MRRVFACILEVFRKEDEGWVVVMMMVEEGEIGPAR